MEILTPPQRLLRQFQVIVEPMFRTIEAAIKTNASLKAIRNALESPPQPDNYLELQLNRC
ncbi:hypothetical protein [Rhodoferax sp.]|uniref:hypothetical protein n=1 Tax=Rhodoferax sp. TaxID=50421 RepID=UPI00275D82F0|nr:hypothetical protein [Rhodoferax sp.]